MSFLSTVLLALGLAMDAFCVSVTGGMVSGTADFVFAFKIALFFAGFQMLMPWVGWHLGQSVAIYLGQYDRWIAFSLLLLIGIKMIYESFQSGEQKPSLNFNSIVTLLLLAIATSVDAFAVGVSFSFLRWDIYKPILIIGIITLLLSLIGVKIGKVLGCLMKRYAELAGGIILILIGLRVLTGYNI
ncbi:MAG TPA: manganese efflux pump MntP family protein [Atribacterota bacterium]|nr:manganese efflux pump MntP family protein [Atribacterota bacterium]